MLTRRIFLALVACLLSASLAHAKYPERPIRIIVPFAPGGSVDILARVVADQIAGPLGQSVIVENRAGGASAVGSELVARAEPDGYTLLMASTSSLAINPSLRKLNYDPVKDFTPITLVGSVPHVLVINAGLPPKNLKEFIAYARERPGQINYGSAGPGTPHHLAGIMLNQMAGMKVVDIPYKGTGPALIDLVGGTVSVMSVDMAPALVYIHSGKLRPLAVATPQRSPFAPEIPTTAEAGLPGFLVTGWYGIVAPAGVPGDVAARLAQVISDALKTPVMREKLEAIGATPEGGTPEQFGQHLQREITKWSTVIQESGFRLE